MNPGMMRDIGGIEMPEYFGKLVADANEKRPPAPPPAARSAARKTIGLKNVLEEFKFKGIIAGIRRDEQATRAKERVFSLRSRSCRALACLARKRGENIKLNLLTEVPGEQRGTRATTRSTVEVDPDMFGGDYSLTPIRPEKLGDNPAKTMLAVQMWKDEVGTIDAVAESIGESDTYGWMATVFAQRTLLATPEGRKMVLEDVAKQNADLRELERNKLREQQMVDEQGLPMGMAAGVEGLQTPDANGQPMLTADLGNGGGGAAQSLGAQFGAAQATGPINNIAAAGGDASALGAQLADRTLVAVDGGDTFSSKIPIGGVAALDPAPGTEVAVGSSVKVITSKGSPPVDIPDVKGMSENAARAALECWSADIAASCTSCGGSCTSTRTFSW